MTVDPAHRQHRFDHRGETYYFCSAGCRTKFAADPAKYLSPKREQPKADAARRHDLHLPDASGDPPGRSRHLPDLRHGAGAGDGHRRRAAQSRTRRHDAAVLDRPGAVAAGCRARDGRASRRRVTAVSTRRCRTGSSSSSRRRSCCGRAGRSSCAAGNRCVTRNLNMFTLIAMGTGVAYVYSVVAHARARHLPGDVPRPWRRGRGLFRGRRRHHRAGAARPGAGAARARSDLGRDPRAARPCAEDRAAHRRRRRRRGGRARQPQRSATGCASGRAKRCRSTASCSRAAPRSTNRW